MYASEVSGRSAGSPEGLGPWLPCSHGHRPTASWCVTLGSRVVHQSRAEMRRALTLVSCGTLPVSTLRSSSHSLVFKGVCDTAVLLSWSPLGPLQTWPHLLCCSCGLPHPECPSPGSLDTSLSKALHVSRFLVSVEEIDVTTSCGLAHISDCSLASCCCF